MDINELSHFVENFALFQESINNSRLTSDLARFHGLLSGFSTAKDLSETYEKSLATSYNIFKILKNIYKDEERTHSPFLADLLNCNGNHKQGALFFNEFINLLDIPNKEFFNTYNKDFLFVKLERYTGDGSIDILISYHDNLKYFGIAIENKVDAKDQPDQLERYNHFLESVYKDNYLLLYLSPDGHRPSIPYSIKETTFVRLQRENKILIISYRDHIIKMLENTFAHIQAENIRMIISQYYKIIKNF